MKSKREKQEQECLDGNICLNKYRPSLNAYLKYCAIKETFKYSRLF